MRILVLSALVSLLGCSVGPREVETTIKLGAERVDIDVQLRDIRALPADDLGQLRLYAEYQTWHETWVDDMKWAPTPNVYRFTPGPGRLGLTMHATMTRAEFDRCGRGFTTDGGVPACNHFPIELGATGYSVETHLKTNKIEVPAGTKVTWPANTTSMTLRVTVTAEMEKVVEGPSLLRGYELMTSDPANAAQALKQIELSEHRFTDDSAEAWRQFTTDLRACTEVKWCALRQESVRRSQAQLIYRTLQRSREAGVGVREPPAKESPLGWLSEPVFKLVPKDSFAIIDELRLRVLYETGLANYRERGELGWEPSTWAPVCRADVMKKKSLREFCTRLGVP